MPLAISSCTSHGEPAHGSCRPRLLVFLVPTGKTGKYVTPAQERHTDPRPSTALRVSFSWAQVGARLCDVFARLVKRSSSSFWNLMACLDENSAAAHLSVPLSASITVNFRARPFNGNPKGHHMWKLSPTFSNLGFNVHHLSLGVNQEQSSAHNAEL